MALNSIALRIGRPRLALLELLDLRAQWRPFVLFLLVGGAIGGLAMALLATPLWIATAGTLAGLLVPLVAKWNDDRLRYGQPAMVLSILVYLQAFHTFEHIVQWFQYHILRWPSFVSSGLLSAANAEWVHFVWNWGFLAVAAYMFLNGMRNRWAVLLLVWSTAHTLEHSYMMVRYLDTLHQLGALGVSGVAAQGLPGIIGRDGWLATADATQNTLLCRLPGLTTAVRLDVHFWWNVGEIGLLLPAAERFAQQLRPGASLRDGRRN